MARTRCNSEQYSVARAEEKRIHRRKKATQKKVIAEAQESTDRNDMRWFFATSNGAWHNTAPVPTMCSDREGKLLTDKTMVAAT